MLKVIVIPQSNGQYLLRTSPLNLPIGPRLLSSKPEDGQEYPDLQDTFDKKLDSDRAALRWNLYLIHAAKKRRKQKTRISE